MKKIRLQFHGGGGTGALGGRTRPATVSGIGYLYQSEIVTLDLVTKRLIECSGSPSEMVTQWEVIGPKKERVRLSSSEWRELEGMCMHTLLNGAFCENDPVEGKEYCQLHLDDQKNQEAEAKLSKSVPSKAKKKEAK